MSDYPCASLLIENMDKSLDGPLSSREVKGVEKGWEHGERAAGEENATLRQKLEQAAARRAEVEGDISAIHQLLSYRNSAGVMSAESMLNEVAQHASRLHLQADELAQPKVSGGVE